MTKPSRKPPIDRSAEDAQTSAAAIAAAQDHPMLSVENDPPSYFRAGSGIGSADYIEISIMFFLELSGSPVQVEKGALRTLGMSPDRVAQLSDSAQRFMHPLTASQPST